jgi:hypothetical protein
MLEVIECCNCGGKHYNRGDFIMRPLDEKKSPYRCTTPLRFEDRTMSFYKTDCGHCGKGNNYEIEGGGHFCSYKCFWEWAEQNIPKEDKPPLERLKEMKCESEYFTHEQYVKDQILGEDE